MKITLATPLYPPDIAEQACYVKEVATRLVNMGHDITVVAYAHIPEKIPGVRIITVSKRTPLLIRFIAFAKALAHAAHETDVVYMENGPSVELPTILISLIARRPFVMHIGDKAASKRAEKNTFLQYIGRVARKRARAVIIDIPIKRPEVLPFQQVSTAERAAYDASWETHVNSLMGIFTHV